MRQPAGVQVGARLERLDAPRLALQVLVGAVEEQRDKGPDLVAQGGFGGGEGWLGNQLVVLLRGVFLGSALLYPTRVLVCLCCVRGGCEVARVRGGLGKAGNWGDKGKHTRTVLSTDERRGKSCTPVPRVATEDSRKESEVRSDVTQSL